MFLQYLYQSNRLLAVIAALAFNQCNPAGQGAAILLKNSMR
jgi:hypothetical protein